MEQEGKKKEVVALEEKPKVEESVEDQSSSKGNSLVTVSDLPNLLTPVKIAYFLINIGWESCCAKGQGTLGKAYRRHEDRWSCLVCR